MIRGRDYHGPPGVAVDAAAFVHSSAQLYGDVRIGPGASIWPNVVMRAEALHIEIGEGANVQDFVMVHIGFGSP
ncbi:MAG: gamma carbonic anhydrase family protein, partial [Alphaproteobacteria bacterium]|nr:gamma carbonic anhydrase family protein [Alphaproteobacteria bacterium]